MMMTAAERGDKMTAQCHVSIHMECIGRAGLHTTAERYSGGDVYTCVEALRERQSEGEDDPRLGCQVQRSTPTAQSCGHAV